MFPVSDRFVELILVPELFEQGTTFVRVAMTKEDFLAGLGIIGQLNWIYVVATVF